MDFVTANPNVQDILSKLFSREKHSVVNGCAEKNWLAIKLFFSNVPQTLPRSGEGSVPGPPVDQVNNNRLLSKTWF
jgi:hypothetical protein